MPMRGAVAWLAALGCSSPKHAPSKFDVVSARALSTFAIEITFSDPPDPATAAVIANYTLDPPLQFAGNSTIKGTTVTLGTLQQQGVTYRVAIAGITRKADRAALTGTTTTFTGHVPFNVASVRSTGARSVVIGFDAAPDPIEATTPANYKIHHPIVLELSGPQLSGNSVTLTTSPQSAVEFDCDVSGITRASDHEPLHVTAASFVGIDH